MLIQILTIRQDMHPQTFIAHRDMGRLIAIGRLEENHPKATGQKEAPGLLSVCTEIIFDELNLVWGKNNRWKPSIQERKLNNIKRMA
jgi:hypothetical protein